MGRYPISVSINPFGQNSPVATLLLDASMMRNTYENKIWAPRLREAVASTIARARNELSGQQITIVLLSGGSSNIRWLRPLLERDLHTSLPDAQVLELSENFQEVVAKGLAIECARRYYTHGQGDFRAVTYNRLCLVLRPDDSELEIKRFRATGEILGPRISSNLEEGIILPSASSLRGLIGQPLRWKVKLSKPPKRSLEYFFLRSSFDIDDHVALFNVENRKVFTPPKTNFQQNIEVELVVREDGTVEPRFIYTRNDRSEEKTVSGRPFYLDMTFASDEAIGETYLGFDFGTSTSACSYVDSRDIQTIEDRSRSSGWRELSDLANDLPYPAASPLARFLSETDSSKQFDRGRAAVEGLLTVAAYVTFADHCATSVRPTNHFKGLAHRSAGPLWALLRNIITTDSKRLLFSSPFSDLFAEPNYSQLNKWISEIAMGKHDKEFRIDFVTFLGILGNAVARVFNDLIFGVFEAVTPKRFSTGQFHGIFRNLKGTSQTFIHALKYEGPCAFSDAEVFVVNPQSEIALSLSPLFLWGLSMRIANPGELDLFEFDSIKDDQFSFMAVQFRADQRIEQNGDLEEIWKTLKNMRAQDPKGSVLRNLHFVSSEIN